MCPISVQEGRIDRYAWAQVSRLELEPFDHADNIDQVFSHIFGPIILAYFRLLFSALF